MRRRELLKTMEWGGVPAPRALVKKQLSCWLPKEGDAKDDNE